MKPQVCIELSTYFGFFHRAPSGRSKANSPPTLHAQNNVVSSITVTNTEKNVHNDMKHGAWGDGHAVQTVTDTRAREGAHK